MTRWRYQRYPKLSEAAVRPRPIVDGKALCRTLKAFEADLEMARTDENVDDDLIPTYCVTDRRKRRQTAEAKPEAAEVAEPKDRRKRDVPVALDRRKGERRRQVDPTTCERDYNEEEIEFMQAVEDYKRGFNRPFPTWSEVLEVLKSLGYRKVAEPTSIPLNRAKAAAMSAAEKD